MLNGQQLFVKYSDLTSEQLTRKTTLENSPYHEWVEGIQVGDVQQLQQDGHLEVQLPDSSDVYRFLGKYIESFPNGDYSWHGRLALINGDTLGLDSITGYLALIKKDSAVFGEMVVDTNYFQIRDLGGGIGALVKLKKYVFDGQTCGVPSDTAAFSGPSGTPADNTTVCPVRVLVLFTEAAADENEDIEDIVDLAIANTHAILRNSRVEQNQLSFVLAGTQVLPEVEFQFSGDALDDAENVAQNPFIIGLRNAFEADVVMILTHRIYDDAAGIVTAIGEDETFADEAFGIVQIEFANAPRYTFAHEMAHLFGAHHQGLDICNISPATGGRPFARGFQVVKRKKEWDTVMATCAANQGRIQNFSNPEVRFKKRRTGRADRNDNARVLREEACRVANYITTENPSVFIAGPNEGCQGDVITFSAIVVGVPHPLVFEWRTSSDGFNWGPIQSTTNTLTLTLPNTIGEVVHIQLVAGNANGPQNAAFTSIEVVDDELVCFRSNAQGGSSPNPQQTTSPAVSIFPNPASGTVFLEWMGPVSTEEPVHITVHDLVGRAVMSLERQMPERERFTIELDMRSQPSGWYVVSWQSEGLKGSLPVFIFR